jgi:transposase-like protein
MAAEKVSVECPACGCNDVARAGRVSIWGQIWQRWSCNFCGKTFDLAPEEKPEDRKVVIYPIMICPYPDCGSDKTHVTSTQRPYRYHKCDECGRTWTSMEQRETREI